MTGWLAALLGALGPLLARLPEWLGGTKAPEPVTPKAPGFDAVDKRVDADLAARRGAVPAVVAKPNPYGEDAP